MRPDQHRDTLEQTSGAVMRKAEWVVLALVVVALGASAVLYPQLPDRVTSHWDVRGAADGELSQFWGAFLIPLMLSGLALLFWAVPRIDPLKANIQQFIRYFDGFIILFTLFLLAVHAYVLLWNLGVQLSANAFMPVPIALLFFYLGWMLGRTKRNWFVGIRTPWTLSSDRVWEKTHRLGGRLFMASALLVLVGLFSQNYLIYLILVPVLFSVLFVIGYSYVQYQKETV
ncbi:MAG: hypothetical protein CL878_13615 [Dehalococcoidia bacterium]|nr:hypothetical protein [Dehalococcoidia bacterium]